MLLAVVVLIDRAYQVVSTEINRRDGQFVKWLFAFSLLAPQCVSLLQLPVAEGDDDVVKLQSLALVDGHDAYALHLVALDRLLRDGVVPFGEEVVDVSRAVAEIIVEFVVEEAHIRTLVLELVELEERMERIHQVEQR